MISAPTRLYKKEKTAQFLYCLSWSGWRGSNPLPPPWQGGALPDELQPHIWFFRANAILWLEDGLLTAPTLPLRAESLLLRQKPRWLKYATGIFPRASFRFLSTEVLFFNECQWHSLIKKWCLRAESNHRHGDFQSPALPTELQRQKLATRNGFEPSTSSVTG